MTRQEFKSLDLYTSYTGAIGYTPYDKPVKFLPCMFKEDHVQVIFSDTDFRTYHYKSITLPAKK